MRATQGRSQPTPEGWYHMRIRSIKPEFWRSDDITGLPISTRLTFIGLWSYVDDNGVGLDKLISIVADLYADDFSRDPQETVQRVTDDLRRLAAGGQVVRFRGVHNDRAKDLLYITKWKKHQVVNHPSKGAQYPLPPAEMIEEAARLEETSRESQETLTHEQGNRGSEQGSSGTGEGEILPDPDGSSDSDPLGHITEDDFPDTFKPLYAPAFEEWWEHYPRKAGKRKAFNAWKSARKRASNEDLIDGARRYADDPNRSDQYTKYPEGWLNADGWLDEPLPPRTDGPRYRNGQPLQGADLRAAENANIASLFSTQKAIDQ